MAEQALQFSLVAMALTSTWIVLVLLLRVPLRKWVGARWAYTAWMLPLVGLMTVLLAAGLRSDPERPLEISWITASVNSVTETVGKLELNSQGKDSVSRGTKQVSVSAVLISVWLLGAMLSILLISTRIVHFSQHSRRISRRLSPGEKRQLFHLCPDLQRVTRLDIHMLSTACGPAVSGLRRPILFLPHGFFSHYCTQQQALMLEHELHHLRRGDLYWLVIVRFVRCLFWFNPLVYVAEHFFKLDQELSCDEHVVKNCDSVSRQTYAEALILTMHGFVSAPQASYGAGFGQLRLRTAMLGVHGRKTGSPVLAAGLMGLLLTSSLITGALVKVTPDVQIDRKVVQQLGPYEQLVMYGNPSHSELHLALQSLQQIKARYSDSWNVNERAWLQFITGAAYQMVGDPGQSLAHFRQITVPFNVSPELKSRALNAGARVHFEHERYALTILNLARAGEFAASPMGADEHALQSMAFAGLGMDERALESLDIAVNARMNAGTLPDESWLLAQTVIRLRNGDQQGASKALAQSYELYPDTSFEQRMRAFNEALDKNWNPGQNMNAFAIR